MEHRIRTGIERDSFVMIDEDGQRTLFRLVEVADPHEAVRLACDPRLPRIVARRPPRVGEWALGR